MRHECNLFKSEKKYPDKTSRRSKQSRQSNREKELGIRDEDEEEYNRSNQEEDDW
jgi:hypothetical protein